MLPAAIILVPLTEEELSVCFPCCCKEQLEVQELKYVPTSETSSEWPDSETHSEVSAEEILEAKEMNDQDHRENDQDHRERESEAEKETAMTETDKSGGISWRVVASGLTTDSSQELPLIKSSKINTK